MKQLKIAIITLQLHPFNCGIGDHSVYLSNSLRTMGHKVILIAEKGSIGDGIEITKRGWDTGSLQKLFEYLEDMRPSHVMLQFTPLMYSSPENNRGLDLVEFWHVCNKHWNTSLIVHETYFLEWWYPPSWFKGLNQRELLKKLVDCSRNIFSASRPLVEEMKKWSKDHNVAELPIGSNISFTSTNREALRQQHGILPEDIVLVLFGGGNSLKWLRGHVNAIDRLLNNKGISLYWLLLGGIPKKWFTIHSPVISPGRLLEKEISAWLQVSDIFLMPHFAGLCAKRGTLMTAMLHGLPVVGTRSEMTDTYWDTVNGVDLLPIWAAKSFAASVFNLAIDKNSRMQYGSSNRDYFNEHFLWENISRKLLEEISST